MCGLYMKLGNLHKQPERWADTAFIYVESAKPTGASLENLIFPQVSALYTQDMMKDHIEEVLKSL